MKILAKYIKGDKVIWGIVILLSLLSSLAVYSATRSLAWRMNTSNESYLFKQISLLILGLLLIFVMHRINYTRFARFSAVLFLLSIPLLLYTLIFGTTLNEGARWIRLPIINLTFQTSDLAKLATFMFLAHRLGQKQKVIKDFKKGFLPVFFPMLLICFLIAWANLSTAILLGVTCCILFFIGRVSTKHIMLLAVVGGLGLFTIYGASKALGLGRGSTWEQRINSFVGDDDKGDDFQITQAKIAIANGGILGKGPGGSWAKDYLPHPYSDFIYAIIIEEYGLVGGGALIAIYLLLLWRSILIFRRIPYAFGAFLAVGLGFTLVFQAMLNMAVNVHLMPVTGLTLPLVSMGGSSILFNSIAIGIILSVSRYVDEMEIKKEETKQLVSQ